MSTKTRIVVAALSLSAAGFVALTAHEGYTETAIVPVQGDRPTVGFGMTERPDGSPVRMGDKTTPVQALQRTLAYTSRTDATLRACVKVPLHQAEFDLLADHSYQYGVATTCASSMVRRVNAGDYAGACAGYLAYKFVAGYDCSTPENRRCPGVWTRSKGRFDRCMAAQ
jgi:lysozyme